MSLKDSCCRVRLVKRRMMQGRPAVQIPSVQICAMLYQHLRDCSLIRMRGCVQGCCPPVFIPVVHIHVGAYAQEKRNYRLMPLPRRAMQRP